MEPFNEIWGIGELGAREPGVVFRAITHPLDEVTNASTSVFAIKNVFNFVFIFTVDDDGRRRWSSDTIVMPGAEAIDMEYVVDP